MSRGAWGGGSSPPWPSDTVGCAEAAMSPRAPGSPATPRAGRPSAQLMAFPELLCQAQRAPSATWKMFWELSCVRLSPAMLHPSLWQPKWSVEGYCPGKMWSCKWKHSTQWGCLKIIEKQWRPAHQQRPEELPGRRRDKWLSGTPGNTDHFLDYGNAAWIQGHCCRLNQGPRIHTCCLVPIMCKNLLGQPQTRPPPKHCQQGGRRRLGEREGC